jgi:Type II restriction enzyme SfiI
MHIVEDISTLAFEELEQIERLTLRWIFQAVLDFGMDAYEIFLKSPDDVKDVAEDITRELLDRLPGFNVPQRIFGTVDYKRARYVILPDRIIRQALFVDSKAEKENRTATIQMSQTSLRVRHMRAGGATDESGLLPSISIYDGRQYFTTTAFVHFRYEDRNNLHYLREATVFCLPNGRLQERYNPTPLDTIWLAGRNAPTLGEDFRVRVSFGRLKQKVSWRVQRIRYDEECSGTWEE